MQRWKIGDVTITRILEMQTPVPGTFLMPDATPENLAGHLEWLRPHFVDAEGRLLSSVHALVVETKGKRIVVDTCIGNDKQRRNPAWTNMQLPFLQDLAAAGFPRDRIDLVLCTHLHVDHVGWNTMLVDGRWVPTFPAARYLFSRAEWEYWSTIDDNADGDIVGDSVRPILDAGLADLVETTHRLSDEVWLEPTPGHTPGHASVHISSAGVEAVITGDLMHHPVQCGEPAWNSNFDVDGERARRTRREFLARYADRPVLIFGTHFTTPSAGHIVREGDAYRFRA